MSDSVKDRFLAEPTRCSEKAYDSLRQQLLTVERKYAKGVPNFEHLFSFMAMAHENLGLLAYFVRHDMTAFKQHCSLASKLWLHASRHLPVKDYYMSGGEDHFALEWSLLHPLVSDDQAVIGKVATLETPVLFMYRDNPKAMEFMFHLAQLILRGDYEAAQAKIERGTKKAVGKVSKAYVTGTDFYSLLMKGDKAALEASIMDCIKTSKKGTLLTISDFASPIAASRAKLCWHKGIPVEIEHRRIQARSATAV